MFKNRKILMTSPDALGLRHGPGARVLVGADSQNGYPGNIIASFAATFPAGVLTVSNALKCAVVRMPAGLANGDFQITLTEAIDDAHYTLRWRMDRPAAAARLWPNMVGIGATPTLVKQLTLVNADAANTAADPTSITIELCRLLQGSNP